MPAIEYMLLRINGSARAEIPGFVGDRGHWKSPIDSSFIGWVDSVSDRDYYVPDTIVYLTKQEFVDRQLAIHVVTPFLIDDDDPETIDVAMTNLEVTTMSETWYDAFVAKNAAV